MNTFCVWDDCDQEALYCEGHAHELVVTPHQAAMLGFARAALQIMQENDEWGVDVLDEIADRAQCAGLADADDDGFFRVLA